MGHLYLVQHGAAKPEIEDPQRGLTEEGRRAVEKMAEFLSTLQLSLDSIEHSEKLRAKQTAAILAAWLRPREGMKELAGMAPNDDIEPMQARLEKESKNLMLVGHLPYLSRLAARLLGVEADRTVVQFQMGGVVRMERDHAGRWGVGWMMVPELVGISSSTKPRVRIEEPGGTSR
jgi:phosphohistidine phosphatase